MCRSLIDNLDNLLTDNFDHFQQNNYGSYYNKIEKYWKVDWHLNVDQILRRFRVHIFPYLPAFLI